jgi:molecular chaperone GrpE
MLVLINTIWAVFLISIFFFFYGGKKLHEAIMRGDSNEYEEGIVIEEFRKGFKLGDRLLRPSMVKVSAGPGPAKSNQVESSLEGQDTSKTAEEGNTVSDST